MTELEERFFKMFGIEERDVPNCTLEGGCGIMGCKNCNHLKMVKFYPPITDHILLELVCILSKYFKENYIQWYEIIATDVVTLKTHILNNCCDEDTAPRIKDDVRKLFEE